MNTPHPFAGGLVKHKNQPSDKKPGTFLLHDRLKIRDHKMSKNRWLFGLFLAVLLVLSACSTTPTTSQAEEDFAVYAAAFRFEFKVTSLEGLVISQPTHNFGGGGQSDYLRTQFTDLDSLGLVADFISKNQNEQPLDSIFSGHPEIKVLSQEELSQIFATPGAQAGWNEFHARYPNAGGMITVSRIGYDPSHTHALLEVGMGSAPLAGYGEYLLLEKVSGNWQVIKNLMAWIS